LRLSIVFLPCFNCFLFFQQGNDIFRFVYCHENSEHLSFRFTVNPADFFF